MYGILDTAEFTVHDFEHWMLHRLVHYWTYCSLNLYFLYKLYYTLAVCPCDTLFKNNLSGTIYCKKLHKSCITYSIFQDKHAQRCTNWDWRRLNTGPHHPTIFHCRKDNVWWIFSDYLWHIHYSAINHFPYQNQKYANKISRQIKCVIFQRLP